MMKRTMLAALAVAVTGLFGAAPADAQEFPDYKFDLGVNVGFTAFTSMLDDDHLGEGTDDVRFEAGWLTGAQATFWFTPSIGLRANGTYTERPINQGGMFTMGNDHNLAEDINLWTGSGDLMFRLGGPSVMFGAESRPFLALGVGVAHTNPAGDVVLESTGDDELVGRFFTTNQGSRFIVSENNQLMGLVAIGTDLRLAPNFGLRLELGDRIWDAPLHLPSEAAVDPDEDIGNVQHQPYLQLGAHMLFGLEAPEVVAVAPPPPAPEPEPEPEPAPEEALRICVIDPTADGGIRMVDAIYLPESRDTLVVVNGQRRAFATTLPRNVTVANEADWFVAGEPLTVTFAPDATIEYTTWQSARMIESNQLTFLGTSRGLPVYANTDDVRDIRNDWMEAQRAAASGDLDDILDENAELAAELEEVEFLYVPLRPTGCVFQTVRVVEQVRKK